MLLYSMVEYRQIHADNQQATFLNIRDSLKDKTVGELKELAQNDRLPFAFASLSVTGDLNVGAMLRTAHLLGAKEGYVIGRRKMDNRSCVGVQNYFKIHRLEGRNEDMMSINPERVREIYTERNLMPVVLEDGGTPLHEMNWQEVFDNPPGTPTITMGNEGQGIDIDTMNALKDISGFTHVSIPMRGVMRSFNVGHALAICLWSLVSEMGWS